MDLIAELWAKARMARSDEESDTASGEFDPGSFQTLLDDSRYSVAISGRKELWRRGHFSERESRRAMAEISD